MRPIGLGDELRVALRTDDVCWGLLCLHRADATAGFTEQDVTTLAAAAPHLAAAIRRAVVAERVGEDVTAEGPGVLVIAPDRSVEAATTSAARWLAELDELDVPRSRPLPTAVAAVVERLASSEREDSAAIPRARVRAPSGRWLDIHASFLDGDAQGRFAVVVEPAAPALIAPLIIAAYGLTTRETEVIQKLLAGLARQSVASELRISLHTVNDHAKAIFDKTGVSSAGELRARVFAEHFALSP
jgi:DNA-binding CsgD family transcriptional regulator